MTEGDMVQLNFSCIGVPFAGRRLFTLETWTEIGISDMKGVIHQTIVLNHHTARLSYQIGSETWPNRVKSDWMYQRMVWDKGKVRLFS